MSTAHVDSPPTHAAMALLRSGVPLSLLLDLAYGPRSEELLATERPVIPAARRDCPRPA
jgi:hypothetical protein